MSPDRSLFMEVLVENLTFLTWQQVLMWLIGGVLIYLAIVKEMEPSLLLPMGFGVQTVLNGGRTA